MSDFSNNKDRYGRDFYDRHPVKSYNIFYWLIGLDGKSKRKVSVPITATDDQDAFAKGEEYCNQLPSRRILIAVTKAPLTYILIAIMSFYLWLNSDQTTEKTQQTTQIEQKEEM